LNNFTIGHEASNSMTFIPHFVKYQNHNDDKGIYYVDLAGLSDTGGLLIQIINALITKMIL